MTTSGIELATFRFVAQHLNHCATEVPGYKKGYSNSFLTILWQELSVNIIQIRKFYDYTVSTVVHNMCNLFTYAGSSNSK